MKKRFLILTWKWSICFDWIQSISGLGTSQSHNNGVVRLYLWLSGQNYSIMWPVFRLFSSLPLHFLYWCPPCCLPLHRMYFHSRSCLPMLGEEMDMDSETEGDTLAWQKICSQKVQQVHSSSTLSFLLLLACCWITYNWTTNCVCGVIAYVCVHACVATCAACATVCAYEYM